MNDKAFGYGNTVDRRNRDATSSTSGSSSGRNTPEDIRKLEVLSSPPSSSSMPGSSAESREQPNPKDDRSQWEWFLGFGRNVGTGCLTDSIAKDSVQNEIKSSPSVTESERLKAELYAMARRADVSELELQTLRKQIVKETKSSRNLSRHVERLSKEKDALAKEIESMKDMRVLSQEGKNPERIIEELRLELYHERDASSSLRLQVSKMQESNEELVLAIKDLDEMLKLKDEEISRKFGPRRDEDGDIYSQMEQLVLDYEIVQQENHELSCRLEQSQLQEQLKMHYDCFSCAPAVYELENQIEAMENELEKRSEELRDIMREKIEQEKRAEQTEDDMRKMRTKYVNVATKLQEEFRVLSEQMVLTFEANEIAAAKAVTEASRMRFEKSQIEEMLEKANEEMSSVRDSYETELRGKVDQIEQMKLQIDKKSAQVEDENREIVLMKTEITSLNTDIECLEAKMSSLRSSNDEKGQTIKKLGARHSETTVSAQEHRPDKERSRKRAVKLKGDIKEIKLRARMAEKKQSNQINASDRRTAHHCSEVAKKECPITTSSDSERVWESSISYAGGSKLNEVLHESAILREKNRSMELELKGLQERFSEMSLKFAEVEGERQQLAMTVRSLTHTKSS